MYYSAADEAHTLRQTSTLTMGESGSTEVNGWSLPPTFRSSGDAGAAAAGTHAGATHPAAIPIPVYCRPVTDDPSVQVNSLCFAGFLYHLTNAFIVVSSNQLIATSLSL